ncbi:hypothetical protein QQ054_38590 [Oscillatoria amoena NRMC-F 0135]|nr:hypothetical protein [Oscillatoria amoena NRMC-F 0135]
MAYSMVKAATSTIPIVGSYLSEILATIITPPLEKRREAWFNELATNLGTLQEKGQVDFEKLAENTVFIDTIIRATTYALQTGDEKKLEAFRNFVVNTALIENPKAVKISLYLAKIDNMTSWHIGILLLLDAPKDFLEKINFFYTTNNELSLRGFIFLVFPDMKEEGKIVEGIWEDLRKWGFHDCGDWASIGTQGFKLEQMTTVQGREFVWFLSNNV